jgi:hypothetical protein
MQAQPTAPVADTTDSDTDSSAGMVPHSVVLFQR